MLTQIAPPTQIEKTHLSLAKSHSKKLESFAALKAHFWAMDNGSPVPSVLSDGFIDALLALRLEINTQRAQLIREARRDGLEHERLTEIGFFRALGPEITSVVR